MLRLLVLGLAIIVVVQSYASDCQYNKKGDYYCNQRVDAIKQIPGFNASYPSQPLSGNLCTSAANDNGLFRWELCCKACKELLGGAGQAAKENSFVNTAVGEVCADQTIALSLCQKYSTMSTAIKASFCSQASGRQYCPMTCNLCSTAKTQHTTAAACIGGTPCANQSMCNRQSMTTYQCTTDGTAPAAGPPAIVVNGGKCNCLDACVNYLSTPCTNDTTCGGAPHSCQAMSGKCACPTCTPNAICYSDNDCGGYVGACGTVSGAPAVFAPIVPDGVATNFGRCIACPGTTPCRGAAAGTTACDSTNAAEVCGHPEYCVTAGGIANGYATDGVNSFKCRPGDADCTCQCKTAPTAALTSGNAPVCIDGVMCGNADGELELCGYGNACKDPATGGACNNALADNVCKCNCTGMPTIGAPNVCLGKATRPDGTATTCPLANPPTGPTILKDAQTVDETCGFMQAAVSPYLWKDACAPDMSTGQCSCMLPISPVYTPMSVAPQLTLKCSKSEDCQTTGDTTAVCATITTAYTKMGLEDEVLQTRCDMDGGANAAAGLCLCVPAHAVLIDNPAADPAQWTCITDADCGWGKCVTADRSALCTETDPTSTACFCQLAGCQHDAACGLSYSTEMCGYAGACEGKCFCG